MKLHALAALLLVVAPAVGDTPEPRPHAVVAHVDPALLAAPAPIAGPMIFAHGNLGIPRVITWANVAGTSGIAWGTTASIAAGNAYVSYDGTNMILNVPTGDGFSFLVNNVEVGGLPTAGGFETNVIQILSGTTLTIQDAAGNAGPVFTDAGTTINTTLDGDLAFGTSPAISFTTTLLFTDGTNTLVTIDDNGTTGGFLLAGTNTSTGCADSEWCVTTESSDYSAPAHVFRDGDFAVFSIQAGAASDTLLTFDNTSNETLTVDAINGWIFETTNAGAGYQWTTSTGQVLMDLDDGGTNAALTVFGTALIDGVTDAVQLTVQGHSTQTSALQIWENSAGTDVASMSNTGDIVALGTGTWTGDMTLNGGVGALGFGAGETIVPADAVLNVTGAITSSNNIVGINVFASGGGALLIDDTNLKLEESGTNDLSITADGAVSGTWSATAANPTGLAGQLAVAHLSGGGGLATGAVAGTGCGTASAPTQSGNDIGGSLGATCGTAGTAANPIVTITFADAYSTAPFCTIAAENAATAALMVSAQIVPVTTTTTLAVNCGGGTCPTGALAWRYSCSQ